MTRTLTMEEIEETRVELGAKLSEISGSLDKVDVALWTLEQAAVPADMLRFKGTLERSIDVVRRSILGRKINLMEQAYLIGGVLA